MSFQFCFIPIKHLFNFCSATVLANTNGTGLIVHRLKTAWGPPVYLSSAGCMQYSKETGKEDHFICVSRRLSKYEGDLEIQKFEKRFEPMIGSQTPTELFQELNVSIGPRSNVRSNAPDLKGKTIVYDQEKMQLKAIEQSYSPNRDSCTTTVTRLARPSSLDIAITELDSDVNKTDDGNSKSDCISNDSVKQSFDYNHNDISNLKTMMENDNYPQIASRQIVKKDVKVELVNGQRVLCESFQTSARASSFSPVPSRYFKLDTVRNPELPLQPQPFLTPALPSLSSRALATNSDFDHTPLIKSLYSKSITKDFTHVKPGANPIYRANAGANGSPGHTFSVKSLSNFDDSGKMVSQALFVNMVENEDSCDQESDCENPYLRSANESSTLMLENQESNGSGVSDSIGSSYNQTAQSIHSQPSMYETLNVPEGMSTTITGPESEFSFANSSIGDHCNAQPVTSVEVAGTSEVRPQRRLLVQRNYMHLTPEQAYAVNPNMLHDPVTFTQTIAEELSQRQIKAFTSSHQRSFAYDSQASFVPSTQLALPFNEYASNVSPASTHESSSNYSSTYSRNVDLSSKSFYIFFHF